MKFRDLLKRQLISEIEAILALKRLVVPHSHQVTLHKLMGNQKCSSESTNTTISSLTFLPF